MRHEEHNHGSQVAPLKTVHTEQELRPDHRSDEDCTAPLRQLPHLGGDQARQCVCALCLQKGKLLQDLGFLTFTALRWNDLKTVSQRADEAHCAALVDKVMRQGCGNA